MIEFGNSLRAAREAKGYSICQLSEMTRIAPSTLAELESENFTHIAAPIYGRGFVKLYCESVGLDPKPLINEFMEIYNGNRDTCIRERPITDAAPAEVKAPAVETNEPPIAEPLPIAEEPPIATPLPDDSTQTPELNSPPEPAPEPDLFNQQVAFANPAPSQEPTLARYAAPIHQDRKSLEPRSYLRLEILAVGALVLLAILAFGLRAVYRATTRPEIPPAEFPALATEPAVQSPSKTTPTPSADSKAPRTPQKIPSLYID